MLELSHITETLLKERLSLTAFIYSICRNYHLAEDVYQEVTVKALSQQTEGQSQGNAAGQSFESKAHLMNWFKRSARNRAIDHMRSSKMKTNLSSMSVLSAETLDVLAAHWEPEGQEGSEAALGHEGNGSHEAALTALATCVDKLTPRSQEVLRLRYFEGNSGKQIASKLGRKIETVYQTIFRAHKALGDCVKREMTGSHS